MTPDAVYAYRHQHGFTTPLAPVTQGAMFCVFSSRGSYEWLAHPDDAAFYLTHGIVVDGEHLQAGFIDEHPFMGAWHIAAAKPAANTLFIEASESTLIAA